MRVLFLGNNRVGWQILAYLKAQQEEVVGVVVHPTEKRKYGPEIIGTAGVDEGRIFEAQHLRGFEALNAIASLRPDIGVCVLFDHVLRSEFISLFPLGIVNVHPSYLPHNRGQYPNVWSIVERTPAGVTLHYIDDESVDTGDIIARQRVNVEPVDTGESLYRKLETAGIALFQQTWPDIQAGRVQRHPQVLTEGNCHKTRDVDRIDVIDLDKTYTARELIDIIRARTFAPYPGAYFMENGRKVYLRLQLLYEEQLNGNQGRFDNSTAS